MTHETLRLAREAKGWGLDELSRRSGVRPRTLGLIERGEFAELPAGLYCRSSIRSYAAAVGLDPDGAVESLRAYLPMPEDPLDGLARRHGHARKAEPKPRELPVDSAAPPSRGPLEAPVATAWTSVPATPLSEILHEPAASAEIEPPDSRETDLEARRQPTGRPSWRPLAASAIDGALLVAMGGALVWLTAMACGTSVQMALRIGGPGMAVVFALIVALYFVLFGGVGNATPGVALMRLDAPPPGRIVLNPRDVFGRARRSIFHDSSLLTE